MTSCVSEEILEPDTGENGDGVNNEEGDALLSIKLYVDNAPPQTRADETYMNLTQEKEIKDVRVILYGTDGKAAYINDYDIGDPNQWYDISPPLYQTKSIRVKPQDYDIAVLVNYKNSWGYYTGNYNVNTSIALRTSQLGHDKDVLTDTPLDFAAGGAPYTAAKTMAMQTLTGSFDTPPAYASADYIKGNYRFFMSNADGLLHVGGEQIKRTEKEAEDNPLTLYVERAVAKVGFLRNENVRVADYFAVTNVFATNDNVPYKPFHEMVFDNDFDLVSWRTDMINMKTYPIRQKAQIAPFPIGSGEGLSMEVDVTDRRDRYAVDPNHTTAVSGIGGELFVIPDDGDDPIYAGTVSAPVWSGYSAAYLGLPLRVGKGYASDTDIDLSVDSYDHFEYVTENTVTPANYNTATATNILVRVQIGAYFVYGPRRDGQPQDRSITPFANVNIEYYRSDFFGDYAVYKGKIYPLEVLVEWLYEVNSNGSITSPDGEMVARPLLFYDPRIDYSFLKNEEGYLGKNYFDEAGIFPISPDELIADFGERDDPDPVKKEMRDKLIENIKIEQNGPDLTVSTKAAGEIHGVKFFKDGMNYYRVPVRHFSDVQSPDADSYGRYGVVRNNTYVMRLDAINGLGEPTPGTGEIEEEEPDKFLSVSFRVLPWVDRIHEVIVEE